MPTLTPEMMTVIISTIALLTTAAQFVVSLNIRTQIMELKVWCLQTFRLQSANGDHDNSR